MKLLFEEEENKTLEDLGDDKEPETSVNPPEPTPAEEKIMEPLIENSGENESIEPPKQRSPEEESMETVIQEDGALVKNETTKETDAVEQGGVDGIEEEMKEFVSCEKVSSENEAVSGKILPDLGDGAQAPETTHQKEVEITAARDPGNQDKVLTSEGSELETSQNETETKTASDGEAIPSVVQSGRLYSKEKEADSNSLALASPDKTKQTAPAVKREMSTEERRMMLVTNSPSS